ncbi:MAG: hypothetical protein IT161_15825 [Bryobacterales bacterium]|nr:hypothetical protein [Bryobacterales bacterium]
MARGWESKSVESQQELAAAREPKPATQSPEEVARRARHDSLLLQRTRILSEMQSACNPRFRSQLEAALAHLEAEVRKLE